MDIATFVEITSNGAAATKFTIVGMRSENQDSALACLCHKSGFEVQGIGLTNTRRVQVSMGK